MSSKQFILPEELRMQRFINRIHNLANNLKSGLIDWQEFDKKVTKAVGQVFQDLDK